jgi:CRP-like cAMP-binding protein
LISIISRSDTGAGDWEIITSACNVRRSDMPSTTDLHAATPLIRKLDSIDKLSHTERSALQNLPVKIRSIEARHDILHEGDEASQCCFVIEGWVCRYRMLSEGRRQILSFHIAGDFPDLQSLHMAVMDYSLATLTNAVVALIPHESLKELSERFAGICTRLWRITLLDAAIGREWMLGMGRRPAYERMAHLFCELHLKLQAVGLAEGGRCPLPITQGDLADALGLTSVHVNRVLRDMRSQGLVTLRSRTLTIESWDELLRVCEFNPTYLRLGDRAAA